MADDKKQNEETLNKKESDDYYFKVWKYYENVAMHFNELIIRLRVQSIGGIAAIATILGIFLKDNSANNCNSFNYCLAAIALLVLILFWVAIYLLDMHYYNRLLEGAVNAILKLEKNKNTFLEKKEIYLSTNIEDAFSQHFDHEDKCSFKRVFLGRNGFYLFVFIGLLIPCVLCFFMWLR